MKYEPWNGRLSSAFLYCTSDQIFIQTWYSGISVIRPPLNADIYDNADNLLGPDCTSIDFYLPIQTQSYSGHFANKFVGSLVK